MEVLQSLKKTPLCEIAIKYGTDKCPFINERYVHPYTPFYYELLKERRESIRKVLEIGIGYPSPKFRKERNYVMGASLRMWRDFFPNAHVYGIDIRPDIIFQDERISTFLCDAYDGNQLSELLKKIGTDIDLVIDDGSHKAEHQIFTAKALMPALKDDVIYIIEDVADRRRVIAGLTEYECVLAPLKFTRRFDDKLLIVKRK